VHTTEKLTVNRFDTAYDMIEDINNIRAMSLILLLLSVPGPGLELGPAEVAAQAL